MDNDIAPGHPGIPPRWTSSAKSGVGTAISGLSHVWFTVSHGIVNEVYYPRMDQANTRDFGLLVADGSQFFSEEKRDTTCEILPLARVPATLAFWRFNHKCHRVPAGKVLRIEVLAPARVRWSLDDWRTVHDTQTTDTELGAHYLDVPTASLPRGTAIVFTFFWPQANRWEGHDFAVTVGEGS